MRLVLTTIPSQHALDKLQRALEELLEYLREVAEESSKQKPLKNDYLEGLKEVLRYCWQLR